MQLNWTDELALRAAIFATRRLIECGVPLPNGNRLANARECISRNRGDRPVELATEGALAEEVLEAHRTVMEMYCIASVLSGSEDLLASVVAKAVFGPHLTRPDRTAARNFQFECLVAALLRLAGISDVISAEPDVRILVGESAIGIAAKRVTSLNPTQRRKQVRKALDQIHGQGIPGFIALNLDALAQSEWYARGHEAAIGALSAAVEQAKDYVQARDPGNAVGAIYGFATLLGWNTAVDPAVLVVDISSHAAFMLPEALHQSTSEFVTARGRQLDESLTLLVERLNSLPPAS